LPEALIEEEVSSIVDEAAAAAAAAAAADDDTTTSVVIIGGGTAELKKSAFSSAVRNILLTLLVRSILTVTADGLLLFVREHSDVSFENTSLTMSFAFRSL
jgi:hypothetical protein